VENKNCIVKVYFYSQLNGIKDDKTMEIKTK